MLGGMGIAALNPSYPAQSAQQRDIRNTEEQPTQLRQQRITVGAHLGVIGIDQHRLEERIYWFAQAGQLLQRFTVLACGG